MNIQIKNKHAAFTILLMLASFLYSCYNDHGANTIIEEPYRIKVDDFTFSNDTLSVADTLTVYFLGTAGTDTCHKFSHFQYTKEDHRADFTVWGNYRHKMAGTCKDSIMTMDGIYFKIYPFIPGDFSVAVHQPDGSLFSKTVFIK
ncbi:MAG: hypothetical protein EHM58_07065 [Ignavibacteriae bacterium]|nr:MAG: hypothetical protein EHM58_07065 [Ignavibacteriota bacterium]